MGDHVAIERTQLLASVSSEQTQPQALAAKHRLNQLTPVGKLPTEVLLIVFMYLSSTWHTGDRTWFWVTHVCHAWRATAIDFPALWAQIAAHSVEWTQMLLSRSQGAQLDVVVLPAANPYAEVVQLIARELHRTRTLEWCNYSEPTVDPAAPASAPFLSSITLRTDGFTNHIPWSTPFDDIDMPNLERLCITSTPLSWELNKLFAPSLTYLEWYSDNPSYEMYVDANGSMTIVMEVLSGMPSLQFLELGNVLPPPDIDDMGIDISLPMLCSLAIEAPARTALYFLNSVSFPKHADIDIQLRDLGIDEGGADPGDPSETSEAQVVLFLASRFTPDPDSMDTHKPFRSVLCSSEGIDAWTANHGVEGILHGSGDTLRDPVMSPGRDVHLAIGAREELPWAPFARDLFERCCNTFPLAQVTSAFFHLDQLESTHWSAACLAMPHLRELAVSGDPECYELILESLSEADTASQDQELAGTLAELDVLILCDVSIPTDALAEERPPHILHEYADALRARAAAGHKLSRLVLGRSCTGICREDVDMLRGVVREVRHESTLPTLVELREAEADKELRALPPAVLRGLMEEAGLGHSDPAALTRDEKSRLVALCRRHVSALPFRDMRAGAQDPMWCTHIVQDGVVVSVPWRPPAMAPRAAPVWTAPVIAAEPTVGENPAEPSGGR